jgi:hypothetical protein
MPNVYTVPYQGSLHLTWFTNKGQAEIRVKPAVYWKHGAYSLSENEYFKMYIDCISTITTTPKLLCVWYD